MAFRKETVGDLDSFDSILTKLTKHRRQPSVHVAHIGANSAPVYAVNARMPNAALPCDRILELYSAADSLRSKAQMPLPASEEALKQELGLAQGMSVVALIQARKRFSWRNHPDRADDESRSLSLERMQMANAMFDIALGLAREEGFSEKQAKSA
jgi:hypothetical protein